MCQFLLTVHACRWNIDLCWSLMLWRICGLLGSCYVLRSVLVIVRLSSICRHRQSVNSSNDVDHLDWQYWNWTCSSLAVYTVRYFCINQTNLIYFKLFDKIWMSSWLKWVCNAPYLDNKMAGKVCSIWIIQFIQIIFFYYL